MKENLKPCVYKLWKPLRVVDQFGPALVDVALDAVLLAFEAAVLEFLVGRIPVIWAQ